MREGKHFTAPPGLIRLQSLLQDLCRNMELASNLKQHKKFHVLFCTIFSSLYFFFSYLYLCSASTLKTVLQNIVPLQNYSDSIGDELPAGLVTAVLQVQWGSAFCRRPKRRHLYAPNDLPALMVSLEPRRVMIWTSAIMSSVALKNG